MDLRMGDGTRWFNRFGAICAVAGAVAAGVGNGLHPVTPRNDPEGVARVIADSDAWATIHLVIVAGTLLMLAGLVAVRRTMTADHRADALADLAVWAATLGTTIGVVTVILDGVAAKRLADLWAVAPGDVTLQAVTTNETINFALAGLFNATFAGIPFVLLGVAMLRSADWPSWFGLIAVVAGAGSVIAGAFQLLTGRPTTTSLILTIIGPTVIALWVVLAGAFLWVRPAGPADDGQA